jgi:AcrR family transcriptional regulator
VDAQLGLRERKKQRTRALIAETARRLFAERGFEAVSVAEIAREAEVSEATVFNYFPTKEDLVYHGMEAFEADLLAALRRRPAGESVIDAFGRFVSAPRGFLAAADESAKTALLEVSRMIAGSPALRARERQILASYSGSVAELLRDETGADVDDIRPQVVASALVGVHGVLIEYVRRHLLEGPADVRRLARKVRQQGNQAIQLLGGGLATYAVREPRSAPSTLEEGSHG